MCGQQRRKGREGKQCEAQPAWSAIAYATRCLRACFAQAVMALTCLSVRVKKRRRDKQGREQRARQEAQGEATELAVRQRKTRGIEKQARQRERGKEKGPSAA